MRGCPRILLTAAIRDRQVFRQCARQQYVPDINIYAYYRPVQKKYNTIISTTLIHSRFGRYENFTRFFV